MVWPQIKLGPVKARVLTKENLIQTCRYLNPGAESSTQQWTNLEFDWIER